MHQVRGDHSRNEMKLADDRGGTHGRSRRSSIAEAPAGDSRTHSRSQNSRERNGERNGAMRRSRDLPGASVNGGAGVTRPCVLSISCLASSCGSWNSTAYSRHVLSGSPPTCRNSTTYSRYACWRTPSHLQRPTSTTHERALALYTGLAARDAGAVMLLFDGCYPT